MTQSIQKVVVLGLCVVVALLVALPVQAQDEVKITGAELQELLLKPGAASFGVNPNSNNVWIIISHGDGKRDLYWRRLNNPMVWGMWKGTTKIAGDKMCSKWTWGQERCWDVYRIGEDKYESRIEGISPVTWYQGQEASEKARKDKVKMTGSELEEYVSKAGIYAGILHKNNSVWIAVNHGDGKRDVFWRSTVISGLSGSSTGIGRVVGDQFCSKYNTWGPEKCYDNYRIGEDKYEDWFQGNLDSTFYRLK